MGPEVQKDQTLRSLWFEDRDGVRDSIAQNLTPFHYRIIAVYIDYRDFKIPPWNRGANRADIPNFWLRLFRNFKRLEQEAEQHKQNKQRMEQDETYQRYLRQEQRKQGKPIQERQARTLQGKQEGPPSELAAKNYAAWRQKQIKEKRAQEADRHQRLLQQRQRRQLRSPRKRHR